MHNGVALLGRQQGSWLFVKEMLIIQTFPVYPTYGKAIRVVAAEVIVAAVVLGW